MARDNPDQQPSDRPEPTRQESEPAPSKFHQVIYAVKESAKEVWKEAEKRVAVPATALAVLANPLPASLHDSGGSRSQGTSRDNGAEVARPNENMTCRPTSGDRTVSQLPDPVIEIYAQPVREKAPDSGAGTGIPEHIPDPEIRPDPDESVEESGRDHNGWSGGELEA